MTREIKRRARQVVPQVMGACLVAYFAFHALQGDRGFYAYLTLSQELQEAEQERDRLRRERTLLENQVALLRPDSLDPDMLEERARLLLNFGRQNETIIFFDQE